MTVPAPLTKEMGIYQNTYVHVDDVWSAAQWGLAQTTGKPTLSWIEFNDIIHRAFGVCSHVTNVTTVKKEVKNG